MTRPPAPVPSRWAAWRVAGGDTIQVLRATGNTYNGRIVLKISVTIEQSEFSKSHATRCYEYNLRHRMEDYEPRLIDCPQTPALTLTSPPPPLMLSDESVRVLEKLLSDIPVAERSDYRALRRRIRGVFALPGVITVGRGSNNDTFIEVTSGGVPDDCLLATLPPAGRPEVRLEHLEACTGG